VVNALASANAMRSICSPSINRTIQDTPSQLEAIIRTNSGVTAALNGTPSVGITGPLVWAVSGDLYGFSPMIHAAKKTTIVGGGCGSFYHSPASPDQPGVALLPAARRRGMLMGMAKALANLVAVITPKRTWFQFRLRSLFVLVALAAVPCAWLAWKMHYKWRERAAVAELRGLGVWVGYDWQWAIEPQPPGPASIRKHFGDDFFAEVQYVGGFIPDDVDLEPLLAERSDANKAAWMRAYEKFLARWQRLGAPSWDQPFYKENRVSDQTMARIAWLPRLKQLHFADARITDVGMAHLARLRDLEHINLAFTHVTDVGMVNLVNLTRLKSLILVGTDITDRGLIQLARLHRLESLDLGRTGVSDAGLIHLRGLTRLKSLNLDKARVTDAGLDDLSVLVALERLDLERTQVTDSALARFKEWPKLTELNLSRTRTTYKGVAELRKLLPKCSIHR